MLDPQGNKTPDEFTFPMNPTELAEQINVNWKPQAPIGMSHPRLQYSSTGSHSLPAVTFLVDAHLIARETRRNPTADEILDFKRFLQALTVPPMQAMDIAGGSPPRVLFIWPQVVNLICVVQQLGFRHLRFAADGTPLRYEARVSFSEIRDVRMTSEDLRIYGSRRAR